MSWVEKRLGDVVSVKKRINSGSALPYVGMEHISSGTGEFLGELDPVAVKSSTFFFEPGQLLYGRLRPYLNKVLLPEFKGHCSTEVFPIQPSSAIDKKFLFYWFTSDSTVSRIDATCTGARMPRADVHEVLDFGIPVPPLPEQQRIVGKLDAAFAALTEAQAHVERNRANARELFESYLNGVFEDVWQHTEEIPLGALCQFVRGPFGGSLKKSYFVPKGYAVYEQSHAIYDQFEEVRYFIDEVKFAEMKRFELRPGDLIMSCSGTMGRVAIVPEGIKRGVINQALLKLTPGTKLTAEYLKRWMESEAFHIALNRDAGGAAIQNVASVSTLKEIRIPLPNKAEQELIVSKLKDLDAETASLETTYQQKLSELAGLKKAVLGAAFRGEL